MDEENKKSPEELKRENSFNFAKALSSEIGAIDKKRKSEGRKLLDTDTISNCLEKPYDNVPNLQKQSEIMRIYNNVLKEIQFYKANVINYDHFLVPLDSSKYSGKSDKFFKDMRKASIELEKYHLKTLIPWIIEQVIRLGELYLYKQEGSESITFFKIPNDLCKITHMDGFVHGFSIKLGGIVEKELMYYPTDIQKLYKKNKEGKLKNDKNFVDNYYKLDLSKAVAFSAEILESKTPPYYSGLLGSLSKIKDLEDANMEDAINQNFKLIHQLLPKDSDTGEISIDFNTALQYHQAVKNQMPDGIACVSSPYEINSVTLQNNSTKTYDYLTTLKDNLYNGSGVDSSLFNSENRSTATGVIYSGIVDTLLARNFLDRIKIWLNYDFTKNSALKNFKIVFVDTSVYNKEEKIANACGRLATWSSKLEYLALSGYSPLEALNILELEVNVNFDEYMKPMMNSHVMSGDDVNDEGGRPTKAEETGDINRTAEGEE